jgi:hypothetical protein
MMSLIIILLIVGKYVPSHSSIKGLWHFNEGSGPVAADATSYGNNLSLINGVN